MPTPNISLKNIFPHGGDQRSAFEELSYLLFLREFSKTGLCVRREGAGGDQGLEGMLVDTKHRVLKGLQAKFFIGALDGTQWSDLNGSIQTALKDNDQDKAIKEFVVTLPRKLTKAQNTKWLGLVKQWKTVAKGLGYKTITFTLWDESKILNRLLQDTNRGLLLHYFELPKFDQKRCSEKTATTIKGLGERYQEDLHTPTEAEDFLHLFLKTEHFRKKYCKEMRSQIEPKWLNMMGPHASWPSAAKDKFLEAEAAWENVLPHFGDGIHLPPSFPNLKAALEAAEEALLPYMKELREAFPPAAKSDPYGYRSRTPVEESYNRADNWARGLDQMARFAERAQTSEKQFLLLKGKPGTGKTQVLAEICNQYSQQGGVVLFAEGRIFTGSNGPWEQFIQWADFPGRGVRDFLETFSALAATTPLPSLICIDALNETPQRQWWKTHLQNFAGELKNFPNLKLIVSCRSDYLKQVIPASIAEEKDTAWSYTEHNGLGLHVFEALPKYFKAYRIQGVGIPPLVAEFQVPLFLKTFCEAFAGECPEGGSMSLAMVLEKHANQKALVISERIDCEPRRILDALQDLADAISNQAGLELPEREAQSICEKHYSPPELSKSLYRGLLEESILAEIPSSSDALGLKTSVRFTYERSWDYFLSLKLMAQGKDLSPDLLSKLQDISWRSANSGVFSMLTLRFAEDQGGELCDRIKDEASMWSVYEGFKEALLWRNKTNITKRTVELFEQGVEEGWVRDKFAFLLKLAPNPVHPWNADHLHFLLASVTMAERDRDWTLWVNEALFEARRHHPLSELLNWAENAAIESIPDDQLLLLSTALTWCLSSSIPDRRQRLRNALARLVFKRPLVAASLIEKFLVVDDPYLREGVLFAGASAAHFAENESKDLGKLAEMVHAKVFGGTYVDPNVFVRHYASEICQQAFDKKVLGAKTQSSFTPLFRSKWPRIWSQKTFQKKRDSNEEAGPLFSSIQPNTSGMSYGDFGRYVMQSYVENFQSRRLNQKPAVGRDYFDANIAMRYVAQRVFELKWDPSKVDTHPDVSDNGRHSKVERLSKKYQWIALYELLGHLSDHYHFTGYDKVAIPIKSQKQVLSHSFEDPFSVEVPPEKNVRVWEFTPQPPSWWKTSYQPFPKPLSLAGKRKTIVQIQKEDPFPFLEMEKEGNIYWTLFCTHQWNEPLPLWLNKSHDPRLRQEWDIRSYLVPRKQEGELLKEFSKSHLGRSNGCYWFDDPAFLGSLSGLKDYPAGQDDLRRKCLVRNNFHLDGWKTDAFHTCCGCQGRQTGNNESTGIIPSPQLAELGNLQWKGEGFDFGIKGSNGTLTKNFGVDYLGIFLIQRKPLLAWLKAKKLTVVWRVYGRRFLYNDNNSSVDSGRDYWSAFGLDPKNQIACRGGGTASFPQMKSGIQNLPWKVTTLSKSNPAKRYKRK